VHPAPDFRYYMKNRCAGKTPRRPPNILVDSHAKTIIDANESRKPQFRVVVTSISPIRWAQCAIRQRKKISKIPNEIGIVRWKCGKHIALAGAEIRHFRAVSATSYHSVRA